MRAMWSGYIKSVFFVKRNLLIVRPPVQEMSKRYLSTLGCMLLTGKVQSGDLCQKGSYTDTAGRREHPSLPKQKHAKGGGKKTN